MDNEKVTEKKRILIVYAHQEPKSYNGALKDAAVKVLKDAGHQVTVSDLYSMKFKATTTQEDLERENPNKDLFSYLNESYDAYKQGKMAPDIKEEQNKVTASDLIIFQFPMYWLSVPAIMKGWLDRVLTNGFAHDVSENKFADRGPFTGKKILLSFTTGGPADSFTSEGLHGDMKYILWPLQRAFCFCGFEILTPNIVCNPAGMERSERVRNIEKYGDRLRNVFSEKCLNFSVV